MPDFGSVGDMKNYIVLKNTNLALLYVTSFVESAKANLKLKKVQTKISLMARITLKETREGDIKYCWTDLKIVTVTQTSYIS